MRQWSGELLPTIPCLNKVMMVKTPKRSLNSPKIFVSTAPFGALDPTPRHELDQAGCSVSYNDLNRKLTPEEVAKFASDCDGLIAGTEDLVPLIEANPRLKMIARVGIGLDSVPLGLCRERGIAVSYTPDAVTMAVVELTIGLMVSASRRVAQVDRAIRAGQWIRPQGLRIGEATVGLVGFGRIGSRVARALSGLTPRRILVADILDKRKEISELVVSCGLAIEQVPLDDLLTQSQIVSLHVPLTRVTRGMMDATALNRMQRDAVLINTSRGGVVDEDALLEAMRAGRLAGAAVDVFEQEPYLGPLRDLDNAILTSHLGSCSIDCRARMETEAALDMIRFFRGEPLASPVPEEEFENSR